MSWDKWTYRNKVKFLKDQELDLIEYKMNEFN